MGRSHKLLALIILLLAIKVGLSFSGDAAMALVAGFLFSSFIITPDIDLKIPLMKHRGFTHHLLGFIVAGAIIAVVPLFFDKGISIISIAVGVGFALGWFFHRVGDELSNITGGVQRDWLLYPLLLGALLWLGYDIANSVFDTHEVVTWLT